MYEGRIKGPTGDWMPSIFTGDSQHIIFEGLTPGTNYTVQVRALGGLTGQSDPDESEHAEINAILRGFDEFYDGGLNTIAVELKPHFHVRTQ